MRYTLEYPSELPTAPDDFLSPDVIRDVATRAEAAGFSAIALSEHPAPSLKWRLGGGHDTLDPIAALSFMAAVTTDIRLMTNLYVLPFRNPYLSGHPNGGPRLPRRVRRGRHRRRSGQLNRSRVRVRCSDVMSHRPSRFSYVAR